MKKAEVLNEYFASVFVNEDITSTTDLIEYSKSNGISVTDMYNNYSSSSREEVA